MTHEVNILPHMYSAEQIDEMFPTITAAPEIENAEDYTEMGVRQGRLSRSDHLVASSTCCFIPVCQTARVPLRTVRCDCILGVDIGVLGVEGVPLLRCR